MSKSKLLSPFIWCAIGIGLCKLAVAAPCCGGASSIPSLIMGDDRAQFSAGISYGSVVGDAPTQGIPVFRASSDSEMIETFRMDGAYRIGDDFQAGLGIPVIRRARSTASDSASSTGLGDMSLSAGYEVFPELGYSAWKPKGFLFLQSTLPTSPSIYDANEPFLVDARGRGFFSVGVGSAWVKTYRNWDFFFSLEGHRSFPRSFELSDGSTLHLTPGYGASAVIGAGLSPLGGDLRLGVSVSPIYEGAIRSSGSINSESDLQLLWNTSFQIGYALSNEWSSSAVYTDQTILGPAKNVSLSRTFAISCQRRWEL